MKLIVRFDGACLGNPGPMGIGAVVEEPGGKVLAEISERLPATGTNNVAEYTAVRRGLEKAKELGATDVVVYGDSSLVVNQLLGKFRVREPRLRPLHEAVAKLAADFDSIGLQWVPREQNKHADRLSYAALDDPKEAKLGAPKKPDLGSKETKREHSILCPKCRKPCTLSIQTFKDGSEHVRQDCPEHGYVGYAPNVEPFLSLARQTR